MGPHFGCHQLIPSSVRFIRKIVKLVSSRSLNDGLAILIDIDRRQAKPTQSGVEFQKQLSTVVLGKRCPENMQQIYRRKPMRKYDFNKVAKQLHWYRTSAWVFSCNFVSYFQNTSSLESCFFSSDTSNKWCIRMLKKFDEQFNLLHWGVFRTLSNIFTKWNIRLNITNYLRKMFHL